MSECDLLVALSVEGRQRPALEYKADDFVLASGFAKS